jgi:hypothetical protein
MRRNSLVIPVGLDHEGLEFGLIFRYRSLLANGLESPFGFYLLVAVAKRSTHFTEEFSLSMEDGSGCSLLIVGVGILQIVFQMRLDPFPGLAS